MHNHSDKVNFIWSVADLIRDTFSTSSRWFQRGEKGDRKGPTHHPLFPRLYYDYDAAPQARS